LWFEDPFVEISMKSSKFSLSARKRVTWTIWVAAIVLLLAGGGAAWYFLLGPGSTQARSNSAAQSSAAAGTQTYTTAVKRGDLSISAAGSGKLVAYQSVDLSFSTSGTVADLHVKLGDMVKASQTLASLGSSQTLEANLAAAKLQVLQAQKTLTDLQQNADLSLAQAYSDLLAAQNAYDTALTKSQREANPRCGQDIRTRYAEALSRATQQLANIHAEKPGSDVYIAAKKAYDTALANYNYCASYTSDEKTSTQSALEVAKTAVQVAQEQYDTLKSSAVGAVSGTRAGIDPNELALDEANLKKAQAQLTRAEDQLAGITLTSPIDGKITYLASPAGTLVGTDKFITITSVSPATVEISIDEADIAKMEEGAAVTVTFDALPDQTFTGKIVQVNPQVTTSGQYKVAKGLVELDADAVKTISTLPLGLSASVTITNKEVKNALLVPVIALKNLGSDAYAVMVQGSDGQLKLQTVTVGIQDSDYAEITSGLKEGELVSTGTVRFVAAGSGTSSDSLKNAQNTGSFPGGPGGAPPAP
jgi:HlyD family secretion protein